jgi:hypothetical protein
VYQWEFDPPDYASVLDDLGSEAREALFAVLDALMFDPINYARRPNEPLGKAVRTIEFGGGRGLLTFVYHAPDRLVLVVRVSWID